MSRLQEFKNVGRAMSDAEMDERAAAKFTVAYATVAYPRSLEYRRWCVQSVKIFYQEAVQQKRAARCSSL